MDLRGGNGRCAGLAKRSASADLPEAAIGLSNEPDGRGGGPVLEEPASGPGIAIRRRSRRVAWIPAKDAPIACPVELSKILKK